jgi:hypothetical protein
MSKRGLDHPLGDAFSRKLRVREYRRALLLAASYWEAYPNFEQESGDEFQAEPKRL